MSDAIPSRMYLFSLLLALGRWRAKTDYVRRYGEQLREGYDPLGSDDPKEWRTGVEELCTLSAARDRLLVRKDESDVASQLLSLPIRPGAFRGDGWQLYAYSDEVEAFLETAERLLFLLPANGVPGIGSNEELFIYPRLQNAHSDAVCGAAPAERAATLEHPWHRPFLFSVLHTFVCWRAKMILYKQGVDDEGPSRVDPLACQNQGTWIEGFAELDVLTGISAPVGDFLLDSAERQALERLRPVRSDGPPYHGSWHSYIYSDGVASFLDDANELLFLLARGGFPPDSGGGLFLAF